jgi:hypothetical protein
MKNFLNNLTHRCNYNKIWEINIRELKKNIGIVNNKQKLMIKMYKCHFMRGYTKLIY